VADWAFRAISDDDELEMIQGWNFADNQWLQIGECPYCDEPIPV
jgi:hypothetical protein